MPQNPSTNRPRAYSYVRMSTDVQLKGDSLRRQLEQSRHYAEENGLDLVEGDELHDIGVSAFKGANVTGGALGRFLEAVRSKKVAPGSYLLVESLDRLSRQEIMTSLALFTDITNSGINLVTLSDRHVYQSGKTDFQQLIYSIVIMSRAHEESQMKSHRLSSAWANKRRNVDARKLTGRCPGWLQLTPDKKSFELIEHRAETVRGIFDDCASGIGTYSIARRLNEAGVQPFGSSKGWQISYVTKILKNRAVIGEFQPHRLVNGQRIVEGAPIPDYFPPVINEQLFYRAHAAMTQRRVGSSGRRGAFISNLFSGLAQCALCGSRMHFINKGPEPRGGTYLVCDSAVRGIGCERHPWRYDHFEASFLGFVQELDLEPLLRGEEEAHKRTLIDDKISALEGRREALRRQRERTYELLLNPDVASDYVAEKLRQCEADLISTENDLRRLETERDDLKSDVSRFYESKDQIKSLIARLKTRDSDEVYKLRAQIASKLKALVSTLLVDPTGTAPVRREMVKFMQANPSSEDIVLDRMTTADENGHRSFLVAFKDGRFRCVYPHSSDPLQFKQQLLSTERIANTQRGRKPHTQQNAEYT